MKAPKPRPESLRRRDLEIIGSERMPRTLTIAAQHRPIPNPRRDTVDELAAQVNELTGRLKDVSAETPPPNRLPFSIS